MIGSDEELGATEERLDNNATESAQDSGNTPLADDEHPQLSDLAPASPEDVARKILRDTLKSFPIPGKK